MRLDQENVPATADPEVGSPSSQALVHAATDTALTEDLALALLKQSDLPVEALETLSKNSRLTKLPKVRLGLISHPKTPRHVSLPMLRHLYTFELMQVALALTTPADVKRASDEVLINKLSTISSGERLSLARRASGRIAGELLLDKETRVMQTALENSRLTEAPLVRALTRQNCSTVFVETVCHHAKWSLRREVRIALLRNEKIPLARALEFARSLPVAVLREILQNSRLPANTKAYLIRECQVSR